MNDLEGQPAELHMTMQITRKATGKVDEYHLIGHCTEEEAKALGAIKTEPAENAKKEQA